MPVYQHAQAQTIYIWPENVDSWNFFQSIQTQWTVGPTGAIGLNYAGVEVERKAWGIKSKDWPKLFFEVKAMERATLAAWREKNK